MVTRYAVMVMQTNCNLSFSLYIGSLPTAVVDEDNIIMVPAIGIASGMLSNNSNVISEKSETPPPPPLPPKP